MPEADLMEHYHWLMISTMMDPLVHLSMVHFGLMIMNFSKMDNSMQLNSVMSVQKSVPLEQGKLCSFNLKVIMKLI